MKLVVLGPSQSGKTCLAVGLSDTSYGKTLFKSAFVASANGDASRDHLKALRLTLEGEKWPSGTKEQKSRTLDFEFQWKGKKAEFSFDDYNGENVIKDDFRKKLEELGNEDGVALLVNPGFSYSYVEEPSGEPRFATDAEIVNGKTESGAPVLTDSMFGDSPLARKRLVEQEGIYEQLIKDLATRNGGDKAEKPIVALTVTASDRLESDLSSIRQRFDTFLGTIKNRLDAGSFKWRLFEVSITGKLADQAKPKLDGGLANTSSKPFLWLLGKIGLGIIIKVWMKRALRILAGVAVLALCWAGYVVTATYRADNDIVNWEASCRNKIEKAESGNATDKNLKDAVEYYRKLSGHRGYRQEKATALAQGLEGRIWKVQSELIKTEIKRIQESSGERGGVDDCNKVENLFSLFTPPSASNVTAKEYAELHGKWETEQKPKIQEEHAGWCLREKIEKPLRNSETNHCLAVMGILYPLYDDFNAIDCSKSKKNKSLQDNLASKLDTRVAMEWRDFAIPDFGRAASTNATRENTRAFVKRLEDWKPVTTNGVVEKVKCYATVTNSVPVWCANYEHTSFNARVTEAVRSGELEKLAALYWPQVETNDYLTIGFVSNRWEQTVKGAYEKAEDKYVSGMLERILKRSGCPKFGEADHKEIESKFRSVREPFNAQAISKKLEGKVAVAANKWKDGKRKECEEWVRREIESRSERKGHDLIREYVREKYKHRDHEEIFNETIRDAVYRHCEKCFDNDIAFFKANESDKSKCEKRFNEFFRPLCRSLVEDVKDPDEVSWAIRFAKECADIGNVNKDKGFADAFQETFEIIGINGKIDYKGEKPLEDFLGTKFGLVVFRDSNKEKPTTILERDKSPKVEHNDNEWYVLSNGEGWKVYTSFTDSLHFGMKVHDDRDNEWDYRRDYTDKDAQGFLKSYSPFVDGTSDEVTIELGGQFGKQTKDRQLAAYIQVKMKRISGAGICVLRSRAQEAHKAKK